MAKHVNVNVRVNANAPENNGGFNGLRLRSGARGSFLAKPCVSEVLPYLPSLVRLSPLTGRIASQFATSLVELLGTFRKVGMP